MAAENLQQVMSEIGPALDLAEVMAFPEQRLWTLAFDDGEVVEAETDETGQRMLFTIEVGDLPESRAQDACLTMLQFNFLWARTGGLHLSLAGRTAVLMLELPAECVDVPTLATVLRNLHTQASHWHTVLVTNASREEPPPPTAHAIRV